MPERFQVKTDWSSANKLLIKPTKLKKLITTEELHTETIRTHLPLTQEHSANETVRMLICIVYRTLRKTIVAP